jgi:hypothetical protein
MEPIIRDVFLMTPIGASNLSLFRHINLH